MTDEIEEPARVHEETVRPEWVDYNGHMNVAYFVLVFDHATDAFVERVGINEGNREATGSSIFVVESHITYIDEVMEGEKVYVTTQVLGVDKKRLHLFHRMYRSADDRLAATNELLILHVDLNVRRARPFPDHVADGLIAIADTHAVLPRPEQAGRQISVVGN